MKNFLSKFSLFVALLFCGVSGLFAQDCVSELNLTLENTRGGFYSNQIVVFKSILNGNEFSERSDASGKVTFNVPCGDKFTVAIQNFNQMIEMESPKSNGDVDERTIAYEPFRSEADMFFSMNATEKFEIDHYVRSLPDTSVFGSWMMTRPREMKHFSVLKIQIRDLRHRFLPSEQVTLTGQRRNKSFRGNTSPTGIVVFYLPKGDTYSVNFKHNDDYAFHNVGLSHGSVESNLHLVYLGTKEIERRQREQDRKNLDEEERMRLEKEEFLAWCEEKGYTEEEGYRIKLMSGDFDIPDTVVSAVFNRNEWNDMLIVTDLTGSMNPYAGQLSTWFKHVVSQGQSSKFVFFNDGDGMPNDEKVIGETGGIYYQRCQTNNQLVDLMAEVRANGSGGDCPENNMEALIEGVRKAGSYRELVMIADNNAPVKDIELLDQFKYPVHIVLCGQTGSQILPDYLNIAWKTGGTIHTIEEDVTRIAGMKEGQSLAIRGVEYRIMGGEFVRISD